MSRARTVPVLRRSASLLTVLALASSAASASAQAFAWSRQFGTPQFDAASLAVADEVGGVYVGGNTGGSFGGPNAGFDDSWVARYDRSGARLWIRQFGTTAVDTMLAGASDGVNGIYLTGHTRGGFDGANEGEDDVWLARRDGAGNALWIRQFGTSASEHANGAAPDGAGGVFVVGETRGDLGGPSAGEEDVWLARYDAGGTRLWIRQFGTEAFDNPSALASDGAGGVYVCGSVGGAGAWIARFDAAGSALWERQLGANYDVSAYTVASDGAGGVFVAGETTIAFGGPYAGGFYDAWVARLDPAGDTLWIRQPGTSASDAIATACPDGRGGVYLGAALDFDVRTLRYDETGELEWEAVHGSAGPPGIDAMHGAAPDGAGGVYFCGYTRGSFAGPPLGAEDGWLALVRGSACVTLDFETEDDFLTPLVNGQHLDVEFGRLVALSSSGQNAGLAVFDSTPDGPNDPSQDPDLLVGTGNVLVLQTENYPPDADDVFPRPNDDEDGGIVRFDFVVPVEARGLRLIDVDSGDGTSSIRLLDSNGAARTYTVPAGWTGDRTEGAPGHRRLDLATLAPQPGHASTVVCAEESGFDPLRTVRIECVLAGSCGLDVLVVCPTVASTASLASRNGAGVNPPVLSSVALPVLGRTWRASLDCPHASGLGRLEVRGRALSGRITPYGELLVDGPLLGSVARVHSGAAVGLDWHIPLDITLCGLEIHVQGACLESVAWPRPKLRRTSGVLSNALDLSLGF